MPFLRCGPPNIPDPDGFYDQLLQAHEGLSAEENYALNARQILTLANHNGDREILRAVFEANK